MVSGAGSHYLTNAVWPSGPQGARFILMILGLDPSLVHMVVVYALIFGAPFVQEDAAIFGAATAAATGQAHPVGAFVALLAGLTVSDTWKYWIGALSHRWPRMARWAKDPRVERARDQVLNHLVKALLVARFVPGTRIPLYVACGVFRAPFLKFFILLVVGAIAYITIAFTLIHQLGAMAGEHLHKTLPIVVLAVVIVMLALTWVRPLLKARGAKTSGTGDGGAVQ